MYFWNSEWTSFFRTASSSYSEISFTSDISRRMHRVHSDVQKSETIPLHRSQYIGYFSPILARKKSVGAYEGPCESFDESNQNAHQFCKVGKSGIGECNLECCRFTSLVGGDFTEDIDMSYSLRKFLRFLSFMFLFCFNNATISDGQRPQRMCHGISTSSLHKIDRPSYRWMSENRPCCCPSTDFPCPSLGKSITDNIG